MKRPKQFCKYRITFDDDQNSNSKGMRNTVKECLQYIEAYNGTNESYFNDYKRGTVSIICNETGEEVHSEEVR